MAGHPTSVDRHTCRLHLSGVQDLYHCMQWHSTPKDLLVLLQELQDQHCKECADLRIYYKGVTTSNLDTIQQLRKELADMTKKEASASKALEQITAENRSLHEPLAQACLRSPALQLLAYGSSSSFLQRSVEGSLLQLMW